MKKISFSMIILSLFLTSCQAYFMPSGSMEDTLKVGDHLFAFKANYTPKRGDIVIFKPPHDPEKDYIKRCVAVPGDTFSIKEGAVFLNGEKLDEAYAKGVTTGPFVSKHEKGLIEGRVPAGKIIVLGDNRGNSLDSRYFGYLDIEEHVIGKALFIYMNLKDMGRVGWID